MNNIEAGLLTPEQTPIPLTGVKVEGDLLGRNAKVKVSQRFKNKEKNPIEAVYRFPLPEGAAVCSFKALIGERTITGEIEEREKAFEIYDDALSQGDGAYLMDQERPNIFTLSVGNLNPGTEAQIEIEYVQQLDMEGSKVRFFLPTTISPRYVPSDMEDEDGISVGDKVHPEYSDFISYGLDLSLRIHNGEQIESIESPSHPISIKMKADPITVSLTSDAVLMDRDFILYVDQGDTFQGQAYCLSSDDYDYYHLDLILDSKQFPSKESTERKRAPRKVTFLIDCSGSMHGDSIQEAKRALEICLKSLDTDCYVNIVRFGSTYESLFPRPHRYGEGILKKALNYVEEMQADLGGTEIHSPLERTLDSFASEERHVNKIILITDGEVGNEGQVIDLVRQHKNDAQVFPIGIGAGCNEYFIKGIARAANGASEFIYPGERIEPKVIRVFQKIYQEPIFSPEIMWPGGTGEQAPKMTALFFDTPASLSVRCKNTDNPVDSIKVNAVVDGEEQSWDFPVLELDSESVPLPLIWARARIRDLEEWGEEILASGSRQKERKGKKKDDLIVSLSKEFGILSKLTSFVAVEERKEKDKTTGKLQFRKVPVPVTIGWHGMGRLLAAETMAISCDLLPSEHSIDCIRYSRARISIDEPLPSMSTNRIAKKIIASIPCESKEEKDPVLEILDTQKAAGGLELTVELAKLLEIDLNEFNKAVADLAIESGEIDKTLLLSTAILLKILETDFASERSTWGKIVQKSQDWLGSVVLKYQIEVAGNNIHEWVEIFLGIM